jgi:3-hydroxybutyryl-CoA dehydrogenase
MRRKNAMDVQSIKKVGVIGCGTMGAGIAVCCLRAGYQVIGLEVTDTLLKKGISTIRKIAMETDKTADHPVPAMEPELLDTLLTGTTSYEAFADCDVVIEVAPEKLELKRTIMQQVEAVVQQDTLICTNTSSLPIIDIAAALKSPDRLVGLHFCYPAQTMLLVELISSIQTSKEDEELAYSFGKTLGKTLIRAKDYPGFIINYLQYPFRLNAIRMVERGMASPADIDTAARLGLGHPYGPLEFQDIVGLDVTYNACTAIYEATKDPLFNPPVLMKQMVVSNMLGRKTGKGLYTYK